MRTLDEIPVKNAFPCVYWREHGYLFSAAEPHHLYIGTRASLNEYLQNDKWHLIDCSGRHFDISGWEEIAPFGGLKFWFERLVGRVFAVPILTNERQLTLDELKATLLRVTEDRFRHDIEPYALGDIRAALPHARSHLEAIQIVSKAT